MLFYETKAQDLVDLSKKEDSTLTDISLFQNSFIIDIVQVTVSLVGVLSSFLSYVFLQIYTSNASEGKLNRAKQKKVSCKLET